MQIINSPIRCNFRVQELSGQCESVVKEKKSATVGLHSGVEHFRCNANKTLTALLGKNACVFQLLSYQFIDLKKLNRDKDCKSFNAFSINKKKVYIRENISTENISN